MTETLDATDWAVLTALQAEARLSMTEVARRVNLGATATTDRVRRLEAIGVITGYQAKVDLAKIGLPIQAVIRLQYTPRSHELLRRLLDERTEILECQRITGEDCYVLKVAAEDTAHLEGLVDEIAQFGHATTSMIYSETLAYRGPAATRTLPVAGA